MTEVRRHKQSTRRPPVTLFLIGAAFVFLVMTKGPIHGRDIGTTAPAFDTNLEIECPPHRILSLSTNSLFSDFINDTLKVLDLASRDITKHERPIDFLVNHYDRFPSVKNGFWAEFGVWRGTTLLSAYEGLRNQTTFEGTIAGFDSFEGLPEKWRNGFDEGRFGFDTFDGLPEKWRNGTEDGRFSDLYTKVRVKLPPEVELYKGWFQDSIPVFKASHSGIPAALIHHDGDLFLSTTVTLQLLNDRIKPGTHMIFDELVGYVDFEKHEILALFLWMTEHVGVTLCAMGHSGRIDGNKPQWKSDPKRDAKPIEQSAWFQVISI